MTRSPDPDRRLFFRPRFVTVVERMLAERIAVHPHVLSLAKLALLPALAVALAASGPIATAVVVTTFIATLVLDALDGAIARGRGQTTALGRLLDRATDVPLFLLVAWHAGDVVPWALVLAKVSLDAVLMFLYARGYGSTENRARSVLHAAGLALLVVVALGVGPVALATELVVDVMTLQIAFASIVALHNVGFLQKRFLADAVSGLNLLAGVLSMVAAARGRVDLSLLLLFFGAVCDGLDGALARRFGGTRFGVIADDVADATSYGFAPAAALYFTIGGVVGAVLAVVHATFVIGRLTFFTLTKSSSDPGYFRGVPSTAGGVLALAALLAFPSSPELAALVVGAAAVLMVSFATRHRHLGRALAHVPRAWFALVPFGAVAFVLSLLAAPAPVAGTILVVTFAYALFPTARDFASAVVHRRS